MLEQRQLLDQMLARAEVCLKDLHHQIEEVTGSDEASVVTLEVTVFGALLRLGSQLLGPILSAYAAGLAEASQRRRPCQCGGVKRCVSLRTKTVLSLLGKVTYARVYFHCKECQHAEALGDGRWGARAHAHDSGGGATAGLSERRAQLC